MKKLVSLLLILGIIAAMAVSVCAANEIPLKVYVNGKKLDFPDAQPFIDKNGRTQTPARFIGEELGATVTWNQETKTATFVRGDSKLEIYIGKKDYKLNGQTKQMDTEALLVENRTFVPARYVAEAFGATVEWRGETRTVNIRIPKPGEEGDTRNVNGFIVPKDIELTVVNTESSDFVETNFTLSFFRGDIEKQKDDLEQILLQRLSEKAVKEIMDHIRPKKEPSDIITKKKVYDEKTGQYLVIGRSERRTIVIELYRKGHEPLI